ncbi:hypothetical protein EGR52_01660 [bacterium]|nr:hypothetical protein [bacterium]
MKDKKKIIIVITSCLLLVIGATFAYFVAQIGAGAKSNVDINAKTVDDLKFEVSKDINLSVDQFNFASGAGNLSDNAIAKASLRANASKNTATYNYYVYFNVSLNEFIYTTSDNKPEIVLTITDPNGAEVTSIDGLTYVNATNADGTVVNGFDITTYKGLITVANNHEITSNSSTNYTNQEWNFKVTFINLDTNQAANDSKSLTGEVLIQKDEKVTLANYVKSQYTGTQGENNLYFHDSTLTNGAKDNSYRYAGPSDTTNNFVCFGYDSTDGTCPSDNLYRIIGVFDGEVKLIKYDYANSNLLGTDGNYSLDTYSKTDSSTYKGELTTVNRYYWNTNAANVWSESKLNLVNLNVNYLNNIGTSWSNKIANHNWKVGGNTTSSIKMAISSTAYKNEIITASDVTTYAAKIGLIYASDYGFTVEPNAWTTILRDYDQISITNKNWMYMGFSEWTILRCSENFSSAIAVGYAGNMSNDSVDYYMAIRPVFYLTSSTTYVSGDGTMVKPFIIN